MSAAKHIGCSAVKVSLLAACIATLFVSFVGADPIATLRGSEIGISMPAPPMANQSDETLKRVRSYPEQPPTIPHKITGYQIDRNANQCLSCHEQNGKYVPIGPTARNLNGPCVADSAVNQLEQWVKTGVLTGAPQSAERPVLATFDNEASGSLDHRARAWLEVNCAHCHNPEGSARTSGLDLTSIQLDPAKFGVFKSPVAAGKGTGGRRYDIIPGKPDDSILMYRIESEEPGARMPNLARSMVHHESNQLIRDWILSMPVVEEPAGQK